MKYRNLLFVLAITKLISPIISFLIIVVFAISCFRQKTEDVPRHYPTEVLSRQRVESCSQLSLLEGLMLKEGLEHLFLCTRWNESFPSLFLALERVDRRKWNGLFSDINRRIFDDKEKLGRLIGLVAQFNESGHISNLAKVMGALNDVNFYRIVDTLFICTEDKNRQECEGKPPITRENMRGLFTGLRVSGEILEDTFHVVDQTIPHLESIKEAIDGRENFREERIRIVDEAIRFLAESRKQGGLRPLGRLIYSEEGDLGGALEGNTVGALDIIDKVSEGEMVFLRDLRAFRQILGEEKVRCHPDTDLSVTPEEYLESYVVKISESNAQEFYSFVVGETLLDSYGIHICPSLTKRDVTIDFQGQILEHRPRIGRVKEYLLRAFGHDTSYSILQYVVSSVLNPRDILDLVTSPFFVSLLDLGRAVLDNNHRLLTRIFLVLASLDRETYGAIFRVYDKITAPEHGPRFGHLAQVWGFLDPEEKRAIFSYIDVHVDEDVDTGLLLGFYSSVWRELKGDIVYLAHKALTSDAFVEGLEDVAQHFKGEDVQRDLQAFYSEGHIIRILQVLSSGIENNHLRGHPQGLNAQGLAQRASPLFHK